jgi:hypothetical protein
MDGVEHDSETNRHGRIRVDSTEPTGVEPATKPDVPVTKSNTFLPAVGACGPVRFSLSRPTERVDWKLWDFVFAPPPSPCNDEQANCQVGACYLTVVGVQP